MRIPLLVLFFLVCTIARSQTVSVVSYDTAFPVPNSTTDITQYGLGGGLMTGLIAKNGTYYTIGYFTHLTKYLGSSLLIDTATGTVKVPYKWRIDGRIKTAVADGQGGFYIGGTFTRIGDSTRRFIAHINGMGQPLAMNITVDSTVSKLYLRNDSLFLAGYFDNCSGKSRASFAIHSIAGDSLLAGGRIIGQYNYGNDFLLKGDTVILAGSSKYSGGGNYIKKYNFRTGLSITYPIAENEYNDVRNLAFNADSSIIVYTAGNYIRGIAYNGGQQKYRLDLRFSSVSGYASYLKVWGNTVYAAGLFDFCYAGNAYKGLIKFNATSGVTLTNPVASLDGQISSVHLEDSRLYISGKFNTVNGVDRPNYAVLDTSSFAVLPANLFPGDRVLTQCFSGGNVLISGDFNGLNPIPRYGLAAIDSATNTVLPLNTNMQTFINEVKRSAIRGDTLFILAVTSRGYGCYVYFTELQLYSLTTGLRLYAPNMNYQRMDDFVIDGNYLYASTDHNIKRYSFPSLVRDPTWGTTLNGSLTPTCLSITADSVYAVADNRNDEPCTTHRERAGYLLKFSKTAPYGTLPTIYTYKGVNVLYDKIIFERSLLVNQKMYVQGMFTSLNGTTRRNFACLNVRDGSINSLQTDIPAIDPSIFYFTSNLKLYNGQIWFSSYRYANDTFNYSGFGYIDTTTGKLQSAIGVLLKQNTDNSLNNMRIRDFMFNGNRLILAGDFDSVNNVPVYNLASQRITLNYPSVTYSFTGSGNWNNPANWSGGTMPPAVLPSGSEIIINPSGTGECILNVQQTISPNCKFSVAPGKKLLLPQNLIIY